MQIEMFISILSYLWVHLQSIELCCNQVTCITMHNSSLISIVSHCNAGGKFPTLPLLQVSSLRSMCLTDCTRMDLPLHVCFMWRLRKPPPSLSTSSMYFCQASSF